MSKDHIIIQNTLKRMDNHLEEHRGRAGRMQLWIDYHGRRLEHLSNSIDERMARLDALIKQGC